MTTNMITASLAPQSNPRKAAKTLAGCPPHCSQNCKWTLSDEDGQFSISRFPEACVFFKYTGIIPKAFICISKTNYDEQMMDQFPVLGHQMTHSIDSFITDSANSATALYTGHKSTVNALGVYADSSKSPFDDPKIETIAELFWRIAGGHVGIVSTAFIADATPTTLTAHTRDRSQYGAVVDSFLNGITNYTWTNWTGPDVLFGGGAEQFYDPKLGGKTYLNKDYYTEFANKGYQIL